VSFANEAAPLAKSQTASRVEYYVMPNQQEFKHVTPTVLVSRRQAAETLGVGPTTVYRYERQRRLTPVKLSTRVTRYYRSQVEALIANAAAAETAPHQASNKH